jgi:alanyl-tRNA synthetase
MNSSEIRRKFLDYFVGHGHDAVPSSPLVPRADPTLMFANAGMVQFKDVFLGRETRPYSRAASCQKCIRISGKHNDLENVGRTSRHHTFFEMLGNFSFGDYFKRDAIRFGWELLTEGYRLDPDRLVVTVYEEDDEAAGLWLRDMGIPESRFFRRGASDNFWAMGETGPCGPCSEIHFDRGDAFGPPDPDNGERYFEIWNLVFMQFERAEAGGPLRPLPRPSIDTGAGLERIAAVLQGVESNYDTDLFRPLIDRAAEIAGKRYGAVPADDVSLRVIADHARMAAFLIAEGVFPEKSGREYVLRRVMRRAVRHGHRLGIDRPFLHEIADRVIDRMGEAYPDLVARRALVGEIVRLEETRFRATLQRGLDLLAANRDWREEAAGRVLPGDVAFKLVDTFGFPLDLIEVIGEEDGFRVDREGFERAMSAQRERSVWKGSGEERLAAGYLAVHDRCGATRFEGYERDVVEGATVAGLLAGGGEVDAIGPGERGGVVLDRTPFYGEAGGQVGDTGAFDAPGLRVRVENALRPVGDLILHHVVVEEGTLRRGALVRAAVDVERRAAVRRHHTATHLLHHALRTVVGPHATQKGSLVASERPSRRDASSRWSTRGSSTTTKCRRRSRTSSPPGGSAPWRSSRRSTGRPSGSSAPRPRAWSCAAARTSGAPATSAWSGSSPRRGSPRGCAASRRSRDARRSSTSGAGRICSRRPPGCCASDRASFPTGSASCWPARRTAIGRLPSSSAVWPRGACATPGRGNRGKPARWRGCGCTPDASRSANRRCCASWPTPSGRSSPPASSFSAASPAARPTCWRPSRPT